MQNLERVATGGVHGGPSAVLDTRGAEPTIRSTRTGWVCWFAMIRVGLHALVGR